LWQLDSMEGGETPMDAGLPEPRLMTGGRCSHGDDGLVGKILDEIPDKFIRVDGSAQDSLLRMTPYSSLETARRHDRAVNNRGLPAMKVA
jgi:hypothetical protein